MLRAPVQARDLFDLSPRCGMPGQPRSARTSRTRRRLRSATPPTGCCVWRASFGSNLSRTFALLTERLRSLCYSPDFTGTAGDSPAALGNRIAAAAIAAGRHDGSLEALHYVDASYVPMNGPLVVSAAGSTVHDRRSGSRSRSGRSQRTGLLRFRRRSSASSARSGAMSAASRRGVPIDPGPPPFGDPSAASYKQAAVAVIRATSRKGTAIAGSSPADWNARGEHRARFLAAARRQALRRAQRRAERRRDRGVWREAQVSVAAADLDDPLPRVPGAVERSKAPSTTRASARPGTDRAERRQESRCALQGRWVLGAGWTPPAATPASPGWVSERSAFSYAAAAVLGRSFERQARAVEPGSASQAGSRRPPTWRRGARSARRSGSAAARAGAVR